MLVTRKEKSKARLSRDADMISKLENMDVMIGNGHFKRKDSEFENSSYDAPNDYNSNSHTNSRENEIRGLAGNVRNTTEADSSSELNRLSGELNLSVTQKMNGLMNRVSSQFQRAINEAINGQGVPPSLT